MLVGRPFALSLTEFLEARQTMIFRRMGRTFACCEASIDGASQGENCDSYASDCGVVINLNTGLIIVNGHKEHGFHQGMDVSYLVQW